MTTVANSPCVSLLAAKPARRCPRGVVEVQRYSGCQRRRHAHQRAWCLSLHRHERCHPGSVTRCDLDSSSLHSIPAHHVEQDTLAVAKTTHYDPRCSASCVAVTTALSMMLSQVATTGAVKSTPVDIVNEAERVAQVGPCFATLRVSAVLMRKLLFAGCPTERARGVGRKW